MSQFGVGYAEPEGGIYLSTQFDLFQILDVTTNEEIRQWLLEEAGVAVVPFKPSVWKRIRVGSN